MPSTASKFAPAVMSRRLFTMFQLILDQRVSSSPILQTARGLTPLPPGNSRVTKRNMPPGVMLPSNHVYGEPSTPLVSPLQEPKPAEHEPRWNSGPFLTASFTISKTFLWSFLPGAAPPMPVKGSAAAHLPLGHPRLDVRATATGAAPRLQGNRARRDHPARDRRRRRRRRRHEAPESGVDGRANDAAGHHHGEQGATTHHGCEGRGAREECRLGCRLK